MGEDVDARADEGREAFEEGYQGDERVEVASGYGDHDHEEEEKVDEDCEGD